MIPEDDIPQITFLINNTFLIAHCLEKKITCNPNMEEHIVSLQNRAWKISQTGYNLLAGRSFPSMYLNTTPQEIEAAIVLLIDTLSETEEFQIIKEQTKKRLEEVEQQWFSLREQSTRIVSQLTGFNFKNRAFQVFITHPALSQGQYLQKNRIAWGGIDRWPNYSIIYLWHEMLHGEDLLVGNDDISHSVIELVTDNELRIQLNGGKYPPFEGHENLYSIREKCLPYWQKYLQKSDRNILEFVEKLKTELGECTSDIK